MKPRTSIPRRRALPRLRLAPALLLALGLLLAGLSGGVASASGDPAATPTIAALGDSITAAWSATTTDPSSDFGNRLAESWSTGTDTAVDSHLQRVGALFGISDLTTIESDNQAASGESVASASCGLLAQVNGSSSCSDADSTHPIAALPDGLDYVTIEGGSADLCGGSIDDPSLMLSAADFGAAVHDALAALQPKMSTTGVVLVASIPDWYALWQAFPTVPGGDPSTQVTSRPSFACPLLFGSSTTDTNRQALADMTVAYNDQLATACADFTFCRYDGGAVYNLRFALDDLSPVDHFHFSPLGQAKLAAAAWTAGWFSGNDPSITGPAQQGETLTAAAGTWISGPAAGSVARSWWRCPSGSCTPAASLVQVAGDQATYSPTAADVGSTILVMETATTGFGTASRPSAATATVTAPPPPPPTTTTTTTTTTAAAPAPPPPPASADLALTMSADNSTAGTITYTLAAKNANGGTGGNVALTVQLPDGVSAASATTDHGSCSGTSTIICQLGSFAAATVANITIVANVTTSQTFTTTASLTEDQSDPNASNNTASLTTTPAAPAAKIPTVAFLGTAGKARVTGLKHSALIVGSFTVSDALGIQVSVVNTKTGQAVAYFAHSRVGLSLTGRTHTLVRSRVDSSSVPISIHVSHDVWVHPERYAVRLVAFTATGQSTAITVGVAK